MAQEKPQNLQDTFLNHVRKQKIPVTVFLVNGVKLQGIITWFDNFCVLLRRDGLSQLVYKHAISTIMPGGPISLFDEEGRRVKAEAGGKPSGQEVRFQIEGSCSNRAIVVHVERKQRNGTARGRAGCSDHDWRRPSVWRSAIDLEIVRN